VFDVERGNILKRVFSVGLIVSLVLCALSLALSFTSSLEEFSESLALLGTLTLLATPLAGLLTVAAYSARKRDLSYLVTSLLVLAIITLSLAIAFLVTPH